MASQNYVEISSGLFFTIFIFSLFINKDRIYPISKIKRFNISEYYSTSNKNMTKKMFDIYKSWKKKNISFTFIINYTNRLSCNHVIPPFK